MSKCPLCNVRKAKRACPALNRRICAVCCGTKRLVEIDCPPECVYLAASKAHPPAVEQRKIERDMAFLLPLLRDLSEAQYALMQVLLGLTFTQSAAAIPPLLDPDVAEGASVLAATLETAGKGIIYQHQAQSIPAQRLVGVLETFVTKLTREAGAHAAAVERDAAVALRQLARGAGSATAAFPGDGDTAFLKLLGRIMASSRAAETEEPSGKAAEADRPSGLIIPG